MYIKNSYKNNLVFMNYYLYNKNTSNLLLWRFVWVVYVQTKELNTCRKSERGRNVYIRKKNLLEKSIFITNCYR